MNYSLTAVHLSGTWDHNPICRGPTTLTPSGFLPPCELPETQLSSVPWLLNCQVSVSQTKPDLPAPAGSPGHGLLIFPIWAPASCPPILS